MEKNACVFQVIQWTEKSKKIQATPTYETRVDGPITVLGRQNFHSECGVNLSQRAFESSDSLHHNEREWPVHQSTINIFTVRCMDQTECLAEVWHLFTEHSGCEIAFTTCLRESTRQNSRESLPFCASIAAAAPNNC